MKILVIGKSKHLYDAINRIYFGSEICCMSWRNDLFTNIKKEQMKYDLIFVVGYHYGSYMMNYDEFTKVNVDNPLTLLKELCKKSPTIVYVSTKTSKYEYTFSRYQYAKEKLAFEILKQYENSYVIRFNTFVDEKNKLLINGSIASRIVMEFLIKLKVVKIISIQEIIDQISDFRVNGNKESKIIKGVLLKIPRSQFTDRLLRLIFG